MSLMNLLTNLNPFKKKVVEDKVVEQKDIEPVFSDEVVEKPKKKMGNQGTGSTWKCSEPEKQMMVSWFATGLTNGEIVERAREELNVEVSAIQVAQYTRAEKWQPLIKKIRESTMNDLASVAGSHKKVRLQRHEKIYDKAVSKNKFDLALKATEAQRKEMEEGNINLTLNQFNVLSDEELEHKKMEVMQRIKLLSQKGGVLDVVSTDKANSTGS